VITINGDQQVARNIERHFIPNKRNVHRSQPKAKTPAVPGRSKRKEPAPSCKVTKGLKNFPWTQQPPNQTVLISEDLIKTDEKILLSCLNRNKNVFAWSALDLVGVSRTIIKHNLRIDPAIHPKKQKLCKLSDEKIEAAKAEVHHPLEAKFIKPINYPTWLANVVVQKKNRKWRMCIDFISLNNACPKDNFPLQRIDKIVDSVVG
jgi:hypothetical protein